MRQLSLALCVVLSPIVPLPAQGEGATELLRAVPGDAFVFASVSDLQGLRDDAAKNGWVRMFRGEEFAPVWKWIRAQEAWQEVFENEDWPIDPAAFIESINGSATVFAAGASLDEFVFGLLLEPGEERSAFDESIDRLFEAAEEHAVFSYETYADVELTMIEPADSESDAPVIGTFFEIDGLSGLVLSTSRESSLEASQGVIDRRSGADESEGVLGSPLVREARSGATSRIEAFFAPQLLVGMAEKAEELDLEEDEEAIVAALGLRQMTWIYGWSDIGPAESTDLGMRLRLPDDGYVRDLAECLRTASLPLMGQMPADTVNLGIYGIDVWKLYESLWEIVGAFVPEDAGISRDQIQGMAQAMAGIDLEGDLLSQLSGDFAGFRAPVSEAEWLSAGGAQLGMQPGEVPAELLVGDAFVAGLSDPAAVKRVFDGLLARMGGMGVESEDFQGTEIRSLPLPTGEALAWAFAPGHLVVSTYPSLVRSFLRQQGSTDGPSAKDNPLFKAHLKGLHDVSVLGLSSSARIVQIALAALDQLLPVFLEQTLSEDEMAKAASFLESMPPLPSAKAVERYLDGTMISMTKRTGSVMELSLSTR